MNILAAVFNQAVEVFRLRELRKQRLPVYHHKQMACSDVHTGLIDLAVEKAALHKAKYICFDDKDVKEAGQQHVSQYHPSIACINHPIDVSDNGTICMVKQLGKGMDVDSYMNEHKDRQLVFFFYTTSPQLVKNVKGDKDIVKLDEGMKVAYEKQLEIKTGHIRRLFYHPVDWLVILAMSVLLVAWSSRRRLSAVVVAGRQPLAGK